MSACSENVTNPETSVHIFAGLKCFEESLFTVYVDVPKFRITFTYFWHLNLKCPLLQRFRNVLTPLQRVNQQKLKLE